MASDDEGTQDMFAALGINKQTLADEIKSRTSCISAGHGPAQDPARGTAGMPVPSAAKQSPAAAAAKQSPAAAAAKEHAPPTEKAKHTKDTNPKPVPKASTSNIHPAEPTPEISDQEVIRLLRHDVNTLRMQIHEKNITHTEYRQKMEKQKSEWDELFKSQNERYNELVARSATDRNRLTDLHRIQTKELNEEIKQLKDTIKNRDETIRTLNERIRTMDIEHTMVLKAPLPPFPAPPASATMTMDSLQEINAEQAKRIGELEDMNKNALKLTGDLIQEFGITKDLCYGMSYFVNSMMAAEAGLIVHMQKEGQHRLIESIVLDRFHRDPMAKCRDDDDAGNKLKDMLEDDQTTQAAILYILDHLQMEWVDNVLKDPGTDMKSRMNYIHETFSHYVDHEHKACNEYAKTYREFLLKLKIDVDKVTSRMILIEENLNQQPNVVNEAKLSTDIMRPEPRIPISIFEPLSDAPQTPSRTFRSIPGGGSPMSVASNHTTATKPTLEEEYDPNNPIIPEIQQRYAGMA